MHTQAVQAERRDVVPLQLRSERAWVQRPYRHAYSTPRAYCQRRVASASSDAPRTPHTPPPQRRKAQSVRAVHIVEIPQPATQGHAHPSPRRSAVDGRPPRAIAPWRGHLTRLRCRDSCRRAAHQTPAWQLPLRHRRGAASASGRRAEAGAICRRATQKGRL